MSDKTSMVTDKGSYLAHHGSLLIENGYNIVPIHFGSKSPGFDGWQGTKATRPMVREWLANGYRDGGVGIITKDTPAVDLDILDKDVADQMQEWCIEHIGPAPVRFGNAPKRILVYRAETPFRKMKSGKYEDEWGDEHEIEILGEGQQFVAFGIHKDTRKPYHWASEQTPLNARADELPVLTVEKARELINHFITVVTDLGWKKKTNSTVSAVKVGDIDLDDPFANVESVVDIAPDTLRDKLMTVPGNEDYDIWVEMGMALYHQFGGDADGLKLWHEWSESADNYEQEALDKHWKSFSIDGKQRTPITARSILKRAKDAAEVAFVKLTEELKTAISAAADEKQWREACDKIRRSEIDKLSRDTLAEIAKQRYTDITGVKISITTVRKQVAFELPTHPKTPSWCRDWVFDASQDKVYHTKMKIAMSIQGFNAVYARQALTKQELMEGRNVPETAPFDLAMNVYRIPEVFGCMYLPGEETIFSRNNIRMANTYPEYQIPAMPEELTSADKAAIKRVEAHIRHLLADPDEQRLFKNWLAWIVQNPGKLLKWAMLLQGVEGDGKSFFGMLLSAVMGPSNVRMINAAVLEGSFTGWAHGQCVIVIEEPRLQGQNKWDVINRVKPLITNPIIEIHSKGKDPYNVPNTTNYFLPTNYRDALPINSNDRRYCALFSRWQQRDTLVEFMHANPNYYSDLYATLDECAPALRKWLVEHEIDADFPSNGDAPKTKAHAYMVEAATPEAIRHINEIIKEDNHPDICEDFINASALPDALIGRDIDIPQTRGLNYMLEHAGYIYLERVKINAAKEEWGRIWTKNPDKFKGAGNTISKEAIRTAILQRRKTRDYDL